MDLNPSSPLGLLIVVIVIVGLALGILWAVRRFLPEVAEPARIIVGIVALIALIVAVASFFGISTS